MPQSATHRNAPGLRSRELKLVRTAAGKRQIELIVALEAAGRQLGIDVAPRLSLKRMVSGWENGAPMSADYRRLFSTVYGISEADLGFIPKAGDQPRYGSPAGVDPVVENAAQLRRDIDSILGQDTTAAQLDSLEARVDLHARDCVRLAPSTMLGRLLSDFQEVKTLAAGGHDRAVKSRFCGIAANYASLVADEMMVLGRPADSHAWHTTARTAADRTEDAVLRARTRSLNALLYLYYGDPTRTVALAQDAQTLSGPAPATALAATVEALAHARAGNEAASRQALRVSEDLFRRQQVDGQEDSVFGFTERRWLFYRSRALLRVGTIADARVGAEDAIACYPVDVVGDPTVITLDVTRRLAHDGDLIQSADIATTVLAEMAPEHRTGLFTGAGREILACLSALGRTHPAVRRLHSLTAGG